MLLKSRVAAAVVIACDFPDYLERTIKNFLKDIGVPCIFLVLRLAEIFWLSLMFELFVVAISNFVCVCVFFFLVVFSVRKRIFLGVPEMSNLLLFFVIEF